MSEAAEELVLKCIYGNTVTLQNLRTNEKSQFDLVTFKDEVLSENKISNYTEIGKAIWAKHKGDEIEIEITGKGIDKYKVVDIINTPKA